MLKEYVDALTTGFLNLNIGITPSLAVNISKFCVYSITIYTIAAIVILIGRLTKQVKIVNTIGTKAFTSGCTIFLVYAIIALYTQRNQFLQLLPYIRPQTLLLFFKHLDAALYLFIMLVIFLFVFAILFWMLSFCFARFLLLFDSNICANGMVKGIFLSLYELFSGVVWLAIIACVFSFGTAIILLPFLLLWASTTTAGRNYTYYYD